MDKFLADLCACAPRPPLLGCSIFEGLCTWMESRPVRTIWTAANPRFGCAAVAADVAAPSAPADGAAGPSTAVTSASSTPRSNRPPEVPEDAVWEASWGQWWWERIISGAVKDFVVADPERSAREDAAKSAKAAADREIRIQAIDDKAATFRDEDSFRGFIARQVHNDDEVGRWADNVMLNCPEPHETVKDWDIMFAERPWHSLRTGSGYIAAKEQYERTALRGRPEKREQREAQWKASRAEAKAAKGTKSRSQ